MVATCGSTSVREVTASGAETEPTESAVEEMESSEMAAAG
jgi:hypothetical protein